MSEPFIAEIRIVSFNFPPKGWAFCNGQTLPINQNQALFAILGTTYGGNGQTTFALPNLQGRSPVYVGAGIVLGNAGGEVNHTLILPEMPAHSHQVSGNSGAANNAAPAGNVWGGPPSGTSPGNIYGTTLNSTLAPSAITNAGQSQPHPNMQPYLVLNFVIALVGIFPSRN